MTFLYKDLLCTFDNVLNVVLPLYCTCYWYSPSPVTVLLKKAFDLSFYYRAAGRRRLQTRWQSHLCRKGKLTVMRDGVITGSGLPMYERNSCHEQLQKLVNISFIHFTNKHTHTHTNTHKQTKNKQTNTRMPTFIIGTFCYHLQATCGHFAVITESPYTYRWPGVHTNFSFLFCSTVLKKTVSIMPYSL